MDAITLLKNDHKTVEQLFKRFEKAGDHAFVEKREVVDRIIEELSVHASIEEQLFYPVARATVPDTEDVALESLEEHHIVKILLSELEKMSAEDERFVAKTTVLIENVRHHVKEEEEEFFPLVRDELGRNALNDLGDAMKEAKNTAPTHPHPHAPDAPPGNVVAGVAAAAADRIGDAVSGVAQGSVNAVNDVIATVLRRKKPQVTPTGSLAARKTATQVRDAAADVTETAVSATRKAKAGGTAAASSAKAGAKRTARTAKRGTTSTSRAARGAAKATSTTAKRGATTTARTARSSAKGAATSAKRGATTTARTARSSAKGTVTSAKRSARKTATTAKRAAARAS